MNFLWTLWKFLGIKHTQSIQRRVEQGLCSLRSHFGVEGFFCLWQNVARLFLISLPNGLKNTKFPVSKGQGKDL